MPSSSSPFICLQLWKFPSLTRCYLEARFNVYVCMRSLIIHSVILVWRILQSKVIQRLRLRLLHLGHIAKSRFHSRPQQRCHLLPARGQIVLPPDTDPRYAFSLTGPLELD